MIDDDLKEHVSATVQFARKRLGLTQEELAAAIGRTPESVSNIERGRQLPSLDTLVLLSRELGIPLLDFFETVETGHGFSRERYRHELRLRELARHLSDRNLVIAVELTEVLTKHR